MERGVWTFNLGGLASSQGQMALYDDNYTNVGNPTGLFKDAKSIWLNEKDNDGTPHGFENVEAGETLSYSYRATQVRFIRSRRRS